MFLTYVITYDFHQSSDKPLICINKMYQRETKAPASNCDTTSSNSNVEQSGLDFVYRIYQVSTLQNISTFTELHEWKSDRRGDNI